jgi:hypothetical protein
VIERGRYVNRERENKRGRGSGCVWGGPGGRRERKTEIIKIELKIVSYNYSKLFAFIFIQEIYGTFLKALLTHVIN